MKRHYVSHFSGMTTDAEFTMIRDRMADEGLLDLERGRDYRRVRGPGGLVTDQPFLHLWRDREEAEAFAARLREGPEDRRWKVFEVDVVGTIDEVLSPEEINRPGFPKVVGVDLESFLDSRGDDALQVRVILADRPDGSRYAWSEVEGLYWLIHEALAANGFDFYALVQFSTQSAEAASLQDVEQD